MGLEELEEDREDDKNSSNHDEAHDHQDNKKPWIFITRGDFQNSHIVKILPVPHEKQPFSFLFFFFSPSFVNGPNRAQVCS